MKKFFALFSLISLLSVSMAEAQDAPAMDAPQEDIFKTKMLYGVGGYGGLLSGIGLSFRVHPVGRFGFQFTGGALKMGDLMYDFGFEGQFDFDSKGRSRFYGYLGIGYYYVERNEKGRTSNRLSSATRGGIGIAYEWAISEKLVFNFNGAFTVFSDGDILPLPQLGLIYYFN